MPKGPGTYESKVGRPKKKKLKGGGVYKMKDGGLFKDKVKTKGVGAATKGIHHKP